MYGELRSALDARDHERLARLVLEQRGSPQYGDVLRYARDIDPDVLSPDRLVQWAMVTDERNCRDRYDGSLVVCGVVVDVSDMEGVTRRWAMRPGWYVLDLWERDEWVRSYAGAPYRDAPRRCLETVGAYLRGEASADTVRRARDDADAAASASFIAHTRDNANVSASYAAYAITYASNAAVYVANASTYAAYAAAYAAYADDAHTVDIATEEREMWHEDWRWHLLWDAFREIS